jgi:hypothetical protein
MRQTPSSETKGETMPRFTVRIEAPATWTVEVEAEDEEEVDIKMQKLVESVAGNPSGLVVDWDEAEWSMDEGVEV